MQPAVRMVARRVQRSMLSPTSLRRIDWTLGDAAVPAGETKARHGVVSPDYLGMLETLFGKRLCTPQRRPGCGSRSRKSKAEMEGQEVFGWSAV
jgi:hypothetical protein